MVERGCRIRENINFVYAENRDNWNSSIIIVLLMIDI